MDDIAFRGLLSPPAPSVCLFSRPRLGALLHRVVGVGLLYLISSIIEGILRVNTVRTHTLRFFLVHVRAFVCMSNLFVSPGSRSVQKQSYIV